VGRCIQYQGRGVLTVGFGNIQAQQLTDKYTSEIDGLITTAKKELAKA
jgi:hypothetical protein